VLAPRGGIRADSAGVRRPIDGGGLSGLACRSLGPARSTREEAADVHCGSGFWGGQRPSLGDYVRETGAPRGRPPPEGTSVAYAHGGTFCLGGLWLRAGCPHTRPPGDDGARSGRAGGDAICLRGPSETRRAALRSCSTTHELYIAWDVYEPQSAATVTVIALERGACHGSHWTLPVIRPVSSSGAT
jgi:hypothetical protein